MAAREDLGSWMEGPRPDPSDPESGPESGSNGSAGLPATGSGALAPLGRRAVAVMIDWLGCLAISSAFFDADPMATLGIFALENVVLVGTVGNTVGHRLLGIRVRSALGPVSINRSATATAPGPRAPSAARAGTGIARAALRTLLLCLVLPAVFTGPDGRGLHDRSAGTIAVRR